MKTLLVFILLFAVKSWGQISRAEMITKIENGTVSFKQTPLVNVSSGVLNKLLAREKARYPRFKESMWYYQYVMQGGFWNIVFYDWTNEECFYLNFKDESLKNRDKAVKSFIENSSNSSVARKESFPLKYCEKLYNFYAEKKD